MLDLNRIYCGDSLELMKEIPDKSIDLVLTDPPYGINYQSNMRVISKKFDKIENDNNNSRFFVYDEAVRVLKDNTVLVAFCSFKNYAEDFNYIGKILDIKNCIIWFKGGGGIGNLFHSLSTDYEMAIVAHKGACKLRGKRYGSVWRDSKVNPNTQEHPTEKPIDIMKKLVETFSDKCNIILDPFCGSGTTCLAAEMLGRRWIGIDISSRYCSIAEKRIALYKSQGKLAFE